MLHVKQSQIIMLLLLSLLSRHSFALLSKSSYGELLVVQPTPVIKVQFVYNLNTRYSTTVTTGSGSFVAENALLTVQTGAAINSSATLMTNAYLTYQPGQGFFSIFPTLFSQGVAGSTQLSGIGNTTDGFFFGYNGTSFGILHRNNSVDTWIPQASWNKDNCLGGGGSGNPSGVTLDPTMGNIYKVQFQWLGFGAINFFLSSPVNDTMIFLHQIQYPNANTTLSLTNPNLQGMLQVANTTNSTNIFLKNGFLSGFIEGVFNKAINIRNSIATTKAIPISVITNLLTIRNNATYQSKTNHSCVYPDEISFFNSNSTNANYVLCTLYLNPTVAGTPSFTNINASTSMVSYDTAGTTLSDGYALFSFYLQPKEAFSFNLSDYNTILYPGDRLVLGCQSLNDNPIIFASISWKEGL